MLTVSPSVIPGLAGPLPGLNVYRGLQQYPVYQGFVQLLNPLGAGSSLTGTVLTMVATQPVPAGDYAVLGYTSNAAPGTVVGSDTKGNTWVTNPQETATLPFGYAIISKVTTEIATGDIYTVTQTNTSGGRALIGGQFTGIASATIDQSGTSNTAANTTATTNAGAPNALPGVVVIGFEILAGTSTNDAATNGSTLGYQFRGKAASTGTVREINMFDRLASAAETSSLVATWTTSLANTGLILTLDLQPQPWVSTSGTAYTDSGTIPVTIALSGVDQVASVDSGTIPVTITLSGADQVASTDAGTIPLTIALSGADSQGMTDAGVIPVTIALSGVDQVADTDSGSIPFTIALSGADAVASVDSGTIPVTVSLSGTDSQGMTDAGAIPVTIILSGADQVASIDAGTIPLTIVLTGSEQYGPVIPGNPRVDRDRTPQVLQPVS